MSIAALLLASVIGLVLGALGGGGSMLVVHVDASLEAFAILLLVVAAGMLLDNMPWHGFLSHSERLS